MWNGTIKQEAIWFTVFLAREVRAGALGEPLRGTWRRRQRIIGKDSLPDILTRPDDDDDDVCVRVYIYITMQWLITYIN